MPDGAVFVPRERNRPLDRWWRDIAFQFEAQLRAENPGRRLRCALRDDRRTECGERVTPLANDVDDIGSHAPREGYYQHLHRRCSGGAVSVDNRDDPRARDIESELFGPSEV